MDKIKKIELLKEKLRKHLEDMKFKNLEIRNIYHEKIDSRFCSEYNIDAPLATYGKQGPHIYIRVNDKIGFGLFEEEIGFNKNLYESGAYWAELLNPDFIILLSEKIKDSEINSNIFRKNKGILLNGFKPLKEKIKKIPIFIVQIENRFTNLNFKYSDVDFFWFINKPIDLDNIKIKSDRLTLNDCYIFGNLYPQKKIIKENKIRLSFNNQIFEDKKVKKTRLKLKFFNHLRDLERKLRAQYKNSKFSIIIEKGNELELDQIHLDINFDGKDFKFLKKGLNLKVVQNSAPIFIKTFLKGFFDRNYLYLSQDLYSGSGGIKKSSIDAQVINLFKKAGLILNKKEIKGLDDSYLEVRRGEFFVKDDWLTIINL